MAAAQTAVSQGDDEERQQQQTGDDRQQDEEQDGWTPAVLDVTVSPQTTICSAGVLTRLQGGVTIVVPTATTINE